MVVNGKVWVWSGAKAAAATQAQGEQLAKLASLGAGAPVVLVKEYLEPGG